MDSLGYNQGVGRILGSFPNGSRRQVISLTLPAFGGYNIPWLMSFFKASTSVLTSQLTSL